MYSIPVRPGKVDVCVCVFVWGVQRTTTTATEDDVNALVFMILKTIHVRATRACKHMPIIAVKRRANCANTDAERGSKQRSPWAGGRFPKATTCSLNLNITIDDHEPDTIVHDTRRNAHTHTHNRHRDSIFICSDFGE